MHNQTTRRLFALGLMLFTAAPAMANKSSVKIEVPESVKPGGTATIRLTVTHSGNSAFHYTKKLRLLANGKEFKTWEFTGSSRPESETFSKEIAIQVQGPLQLAADASCNLHGSAGVATAAVQTKVAGAR